MATNVEGKRFAFRFQADDVAELILTLKQRITSSVTRIKVGVNVGIEVIGRSAFQVVPRFHRWCTRLTLLG